MTKLTCQSFGCTKQIRARGLCTTHWQRRRRMGLIPGLVDPTPAREHLQVLMTAGVTQKALAQRSGVPLPTIRALARPGRHDQITQATESAVLAVAVNQPDPFGDIDSTGTARRLRALAALGWPSADLGAKLQFGRSHIDSLRAGRRPRIEARTAQRVADLFAELYATPGPSKRAADLAANKGWALPLEWDDIDNPNETPSGRRDSFGQQKAKTLDRREQVAEWMDDPRPEWHKGNVPQLAERLGVTWRTIERDKAHIRRQRATRDAA